MSVPNFTPGQYSVPPALEPKDRADGSQRLAFFASAIAVCCGKALQSLLSRSRNGEFGETCQKATSKVFSDQQCTSAVKNLAAIFIYLVMVDVGPTAPQWLLSFLATSAQALDRLVGGPTVKEILQVHEFVTGYDVCPEAGLDICRTMGISQMTTEFAVPVKQFLEGSQKMRYDILLFALSQPYEALDQKLEELRR